MEMSGVQIQTRTHPQKHHEACNVLTKGAKKKGLALIIERIRTNVQESGERSVCTKGSSKGTPTIISNRIVVEAIKWIKWCE